ncbi:hypothetical protein ALI44B_01375 [Leifsonia sp. ALI-44-B]|uniref:nucleotidyl transferase AbiEii/AbiGii toxin family protein n=1 Tax=Leifsonia sp. ALI-44-B TaxID=1933776 RepID=UPI00097C4093|nr:nucleotidyl transferase AbiEii/AbiGii toxin family protein [Leifsonia sp. ALI-44-B]ONI63410.1 hypothetical protein ALI44B_01375 [Leifsonia sp. ALI-44-B]
MRDHLISRILASLAQSVSDDVVFIGGTALARTHLPELRLSEDVDLIAGSGRCLRCVNDAWKGPFR